MQSQTHTRTRLARPWWLWFLLAAGSLALGWLLLRAGVPAPWMIGPFGASLAVALLAHTPLQLPDSVGVVTQAMIGIAISASVGPNTAAQLLQHWLAVLVIVGALLLLSLGYGLLLARASGLDRGTALLGTLPGGAPGMVAMSEAMGADARVVAVMQYLRVLILIVSVALLAPLFQRLSPELHAVPQQADGVTSQIAPLWSYTTTLGIAVGGAWLGVRLRLPAGALVVPTLASAACGLLGVARAPVPAVVLGAAYALTGISVGLRFDRAALVYVGRLLPLLVGSTVLLIASAAGLGWAIAVLAGMDALTAYLATAPGGLDTVGAIAIASGAQTALVFVANLMRFLAIVALGPPLVRLIAKTPGQRLAQPAPVAPQTHDT